MLKAAAVVEFAAALLISVSSTDIPDVTCIV